MSYLVFLTEELAEAANKKISKNMGLKKGITSQWAIPMQTTLATWVIPKPEDRYMKGVVAVEMDTVPELLEVLN